MHHEQTGSGFPVLFVHEAIADSRKTIADCYQAMESSDRELGLLPRGPSEIESIASDALL